MEILTAAEMAETDRRTIAEAGVAMAELMENAGGAVAQFVLRQYPAATRVLVLCGKGNNGGDGLVAARRLAEAGRQVMVGLLSAEAEYRGEAGRVLAAYLSGEGAARQCAVAADAAAVASLGFDAFDLVVDAVVGTGFKPPLRGIALALRERLASLAVPVVAVDLPSGWDADSLEESSAEAFRASAVVTFTRPKLAHVFGHMTPGTTFGPVVVAEIGSPETAVQAAIAGVSPDGAGPNKTLCWSGSSKAIAEVPRPIQSNKGVYGHVLLIAGSYGTAGAPSMASLAALRTGAGLVTAAVPKSILNLVAMVAPELMMTPLEEGAEGAVSLENLAPERLAMLLKRKTVIAVGPGLSTRG
ncbi:MAG: NAD(P)H-hydrate epimerase, partial [Acidobacteria bacterium]|nr:NAD(P)H-hydrate epimerase [Acidobacteriota bacterium]